MTDSELVERFTISEVVLRKSTFEFLLDGTENDLIRQKKEAGEDADQTLKFSVSHQSSDSDDQGGFVCDLTLKLDSRIGDSGVWAAACTHRGTFRWQEGCGLSKDIAQVENAPAIIYSFAREHIADISRKAGKVVVLPPMRFAPPEKSD